MSKMYWSPTRSTQAPESHSHCATAGANGCVPIQFGSITRFVASPFNDYEATGRVDFKISEKDNFFARYVYQKQYNGGINYGNGIDVGDWQFIPSLSQQIGLDWVHTASNAMVNQVRFSYSRAEFVLSGAIVSDLQLECHRPLAQPI